MRAVYRSIVAAVVALVGVFALGVVSTIVPGVALGATSPLVLIMGGSGTPDPDAEVGYVPNIMSYYVNTNPVCASGCTPQGVITPESAWPLYGGLSAPTWKQSILTGTELYDGAVKTALVADPTGQFVLFGYSQSGAILALEKRALADDPDIDESQFHIIVIGNVSRPNGGLNGRLPITIPIVEFPYGPTMPTDTGIETTDIALKWDIIADAPLYVTNPLAMLNALMGGPGVGITHGTYPNPEGDPPTGNIGGYTQAEWQDMMAHPENYPDIIDIQPAADGSDTTYITVTPKILPLVQPLHSIGLKPVADLIEPALRVIIEETGYDRSIPYGTPTTFRLIPVFNPISLAVDLVPAVKQGVDQFVADLTPAAVSTTGDTSLTEDIAPQSRQAGDSTPTPEVVHEEDTAVLDHADPAVDNDAAEETTPRRGVVHPLRTFRPFGQLLRPRVSSGVGDNPRTDESPADTTPASDGQDEQAPSGTTTNDQEPSDQDAAA